MNRRCIIIIPFVKPDDYLFESITGCLRLDYDNFHLVLLPDGPVHLPADITGENISVVVTGDLTIAAKRNIAIRNFNDADYYALIDSDAYPDPDWLSNGIDFLEKNPAYWAVGGPNISPPGEPFLQKVVGNAQQSFLVSGPLHFAKQRSASRECRSLHSCNLILRRTVFDTIGGFDESLFTGEDRNLCNRISKAGKLIFFREDVVVHHHNRPLWHPFLRQRLAYGFCSSAINKRLLNRSNLLLHLPLLWLLLFTLIALAEAFTGENMLLTTSLMAISLIVATIEACRVSSSWREIPHTLMAIVLCYIATTFGQILALTCYNLPLKRIYANRMNPEPPTP